MAMASLTSFPRLVPERTVFLLCDLQGIFRSLTPGFAVLVSSAKLLTAAAPLLDVPCVVTEQYPERFQNTVEEVSLPDGTPVFAKRKFSMLTDEVLAHLASLGETRRSAVLFGMEAHVCVQQTCLDLRALGYDVHLVVDGIGAQTATDRAVAVRRMEQAGALLTTSESVVFELMGTSTHLNFKPVSKLVKACKDEKAACGDDLPAW